MIAPQAKIEDIIKDDIEEQVHGKADFVDANNIDQGNVNQEPQRVKEEQGEANIKDCDLVSEQSEHLVDQNCNSTAKKSN